MDTYPVRSKIARADIPVLCADLAERLRGRPGAVVTCDVTGVHDPDLVTVEALARLRLTARRHGWTLRVEGAGPHLRELIQLVGLGESLGQAEEGEEVGRVEEVVDARDPPV